VGGIADMVEAVARLGKSCHNRFNLLYWKVLKAGLLQPVCD